MIQVTVQQKNKLIISFTMEGHAGFSERGSDLVCAGASSIAFGMVNAISEVCHFAPVLEEADGYLHYSVPARFLENETVQILLTGMVNQLKSLAYSYPDHIQIHFN